MENKVYIVKSFGGEYEDSWETILGIYQNKEDAIAVAEKEFMNHKWRDTLPVPLELYEKSTGYSGVFKEHDYQNNMEDDDPYYDFYDYGGYTKEQWIETYRIYDKNMWDSYTWTSVLEYKVYLDIEEPFKKELEIWKKAISNQ
jgi:hypothetical protein